MQSFGNERQVQQGEDWNLDILLSASNREYIPYIISSERVNPFFVVTVASTKYEKNLRYVKSWWNSVEGQGIPTFYQTVPRSFGEISSEEDIPNNPGEIEGESATTRYLYQYTLEDEDIDRSVGHKPYYYFYYDYSGSQPQLVHGYECHVRQNFLSSETAEWGSQNYMYQITLVSGELMTDRLNTIYYAHGMPADWPNTIEEQYKYVKVQWPNEFQPDIDADSPLGNIQTPEPILTPTKLEVFNNLRTLI